MLCCKSACKRDLARLAPCSPRHHGQRRSQSPQCNVLGKPSVGTNVTRFTTLHVLTLSRSLWTVQAVAVLMSSAYTDASLPGKARKSAEASSFNTSLHHSCNPSMGLQDPVKWGEQIDAGFYSRESSSCWFAHTLVTSDSTCSRWFCVPRPSKNPFPLM